jgi:two-component system CheB/CheR fusion protein
VREGPDFEVIADQPRIGQVVMNLLTNAIKHSPTGSTVKVLTECDKDTVKLSVIDQGKGISKADSERIFEKFVQSKDANRKGGFGLGLAICKLIIEAHKGTVGVKSEEAKGSQFWFTLPNDEDEDGNI